jgi:hypothetical protein
LRRTIQLLIVGSLAAGLLGFGTIAVGAQTGDLAAFCAGRIEANSAETKKENQTAIDKIAAAAPAPVAQAAADLSAQYKKKGDKLFESEAGLALFTPIEAYIYDNCPGTKLPVTAIDYEFQGVPATMAAGPAKIKLTNNAPKEEHEMALFKLTAAGESMDPEKLLAMPEKKVGKYVDFDNAAFAFALPGQSGYSPINLTPGKYVYACFIPQGGKKNGKPHFLLGMNGTLTVS